MTLDNAIQFLAVAHTAVGVTVLLTALILAVVLLIAIVGRMR
jgi:hypothetical protein